MAKSNHLCNLKIRQVKVTNLNYQPEKAGKDKLSPRVDLSLEMETDDTEIAELVRVRTGANVIKTLWDKGGAPVLLDAQPIRFEIHYVGKAEFRFVNDEDSANRRSFDPATLKAMTVEPMADRKGLVKFQVRFDPAHELEFLGDVRIAQKAIFGFTGSGDDSTDAGKQEQLT